MKLLITDANILIDLLKTDTIKEFFKLEYEIYTTQSIINECNDSQQKVLQRYIKAGKLSIYSFTKNDEAEVEKLYHDHKYLSYPDCSVFYVSGLIKAVLLSGDQKLRSVSMDAGIQVRGIFWVFDEMLKYKILDKKVYKAKLSELREVNQWLPQGEFKKRDV